MRWQRVFLIVTACALAGMGLGGLFGFGAGRLAPELFRNVIPWKVVEPVGVATFFGATIGVILGGALGCFAVILQLVAELRRQPPENN